MPASGDSQQCPKHVVVHKGTQHTSPALGKPVLPQSNRQPSYPGQAKSQITPGQPSFSQSVELRGLCRVS